MIPMSLWCPSCLKRWMKPLCVRDGCCDTSVGSPPGLIQSSPGSLVSILTKLSLFSDPSPTIFLGDIKVKTQVSRFLHPRPHPLRKQLLSVGPVCIAPWNVTFLLNPTFCGITCTHRRNWQALRTRVLFFADGWLLSHAAPFHFSLQTSWACLDSLQLQ